MVNQMEIADHMRAGVKYRMSEFFDWIIRNFRVGQCEKRN